MLSAELLLTSSELAALLLILGTTSKLLAAFRLKLEAQRSWFKTGGKRCPLFKLKFEPIVLSAGTVKKLLLGIKFGHKNVVLGDGCNSPEFGAERLKFKFEAAAFSLLDFSKDGAGVTQTALRFIADVARRLGGFRSPGILEH